MNKPPDIYGNEIHKGCVVKWDSNSHPYMRVVAVEDDVIYCTAACSTIEEALTAKRSGFSFTKEAIQKYNIQVVQKAKLGVFDENGDEWEYGDLFDGKPVFMGIKSMNGDGIDYAYYKNKRISSGWSLYISKKYTRTPVPLKTKPEPGIKLIFDGEEVKLSDEAVKGIMEVIGDINKDFGEVE